MKIERLLCGAVLAGLLAMPGAIVHPAFAQSEQLRESQVLDPERDAWVERPDETPGDRGGPLGEARGLLATDEPRKAYKLLDTWVEENPDDDRYYEAVFLLGEAEFERGRYYQAYERYEEVVEATGGELFFTALRREMDVSRAFLAGEKRIVWKILRLPAYDDGIEILDRIWERVPGTRLGEAALKLKADYFFAVGDLQLAQDEYAALAREYPNGRYVQLAMLRSAEAAAGAFPGIKFDDRALLDASERYRQVLGAYPQFAERESVPARLEGIRASRAEKDLDIAQWYERTKQVGAAEYYYRLVLEDYPDTLAASEARLALLGLGVGAPDEEIEP